MAKTLLSNSELNLVEAGRQDLQFAEDATGVDWRLLAGLWYRENSLKKTPPGRVGGCWQFDPVPTRKAMQSLLDKYTTLSQAEKEHIMAGGYNEFKWGAILAAAFLRNKVRWHLDVRVRGDLPDHEIGDSMYAYNGRAYGTDWRNSPYVNNNADSQHMGLKIKGSMPKKDNPRIREYISYPDQRIGAFVVYRQLKSLYPRANNPESKNTKDDIKTNETSPVEKKNNPQKETQIPDSFLPEEKSIFEEFEIIPKPAETKELLTPDSLKVVKNIEVPNKKNKVSFFESVFNFFSNIFR